MTPEQWKKAQEIFATAQSLLPDQRGEFLDRACGGDAELRAEVESLLEHRDAAGSGFLASPPRPAAEPEGPPPSPSPPPVGSPDPAATLDARAPSASSPVASIEGYQVTRELHRGGQGVVYQAIQLATKRKVAVKVLLEGPFASEKSRRRFEREIELVASLHHPNIVAVFDSGMAHGKYWFAMDYIRGTPLDQYVAGKHLSVDDTLKLFARICGAVNYAHQRGVIHRDLKPGNVLVDDQGEPHVLDFGLAKVLSGPDAVGDSRPMLVSVTGQVMGTLPYMSPEQTKGDPSQIDIRTDVYSLGVILYELLTGKYPYEVVGQMADVLRNIAEAEPRKPRTIRRQINDEVETIVLKALAKEPTRRYQSAGHLADDLQRFMAGEAIEAKRDSGWYLLRTSLRRHRGVVRVAGAVALVLIAGSIGTTWGFLGQRNLRLAAQRESYYANIIAARAALDNNDIRTLKDLLNACAKELRGWEWHYLDAQSDGSQMVFYGHTDEVTWSSFSLDGTRVATASADGTARIWEIATGRELVVLNPSSSCCYSAQLSPDGTRVRTTSADNSILVWDACTGKKLFAVQHRYPEHGGPFSRSDQSFSPDGRRMVTPYADSKAAILDSTTGVELVVLDGHQGTVLSAIFSPDGARVVTISSHGIARLWDAANGKAVAVLDWGVGSASFSPDGKRVAFAGDRACVYDSATGRELLALPCHDCRCLGISFSPDGERVATNSADWAARIWDVKTGVEVLAVRTQEKFVVQALVIANGTMLVTLSMSLPMGSRRLDIMRGNVQAWDAATGRELLPFRGHEGQVSSIAYDRSQWLLSTSSCDNTTRVWNLHRIRQHAGVDDTRLWPSMTLRDQTSVAELARCADNSILVKSRDSGEAIAVLRGHRACVNSASFSRDGSRIVTASDDCTVRLWDANSGKALLLFTIPNGIGTAPARAAFSQDETELLIDFGNGSISVMDSIPWRQRYWEIKPRGRR